MKQIIIGDVLSQGWELTKKYWITVLICIIGVSAIESILTSMMGPNPLDIMNLQQNLQSHQDDPQFVISQIVKLYSHAGPMTSIVKLITLALGVGVLQTLLNCVRGKGEFTIDAWKLPAAVYVKVVVTEIIVGIIVGIGTLFCILPGIYLHARLQFTGYYLLDHQEAGIGDALSASWNMTNENGFTLFLLLIVFFFLNVLGLLCCCVGMLVTMIIVQLATTVCYLTLAPEVSAETKNEGGIYEK